jgi:hypothetical protein
MGICKNLNMQILMICLLLQVASNLLDKEGREDNIAVHPRVKSKYISRPQCSSSMCFAKLFHKIPYP